MYALDTNTLIYFFKDMGNVARNMLSIPPKDIAIPSIVLFELEVGIAKSQKSEKRRSQLDKLLAHITVLPFGKKEARTAAAVRAQLEKQGNQIGPYDILISGTALAHQATLITHNTKEFSRIEGLLIEDWF